MNQAQATEERNTEIARDNQEILNELLRDVPHDNKAHTIQLQVKWDGYHIILKNKGLKIDGEDVGESE